MKVDWPYKDSYVPEAKYLPKSLSLSTNKPSVAEKHFKIKQLEEREHQIKVFEK